MELLKNYLEKINNHISVQMCETIAISFAAGLLVGLIIWAVVSCLRKKHQACNTLSIEDSEKGSFSISSHAMYVFVKNLAEEFKGFTVTAVKLIETRAGRQLNVTLLTTPDADVLSLRKELREKLYSKLQENLGISDETIKQINFIIQDMQDKKADNYSE